MAERVLVAVMEGDRFAWIRLSDHAAAEYGPVAELAAATAGREVVALVPATVTLLTRAHVPSNSDAVIEKAVPYAVEDRLADELGAVAIVHSPTGDRLTRDVAVVSHAVIDGIVEAIEKAGVTVTSAVPEITLLPNCGADWSILLRDGVAIVRTGQRTGFSIETTELNTLLQIEPDKLPHTVCIYAAPNEHLQLDLPPDIQVRRVNVDSGLAPLAAAARCENALDFRSGGHPADMANRRRAVVLTAALVLIALVVYGAMSLIQLRQVESLIATQQQEQIQTFTNAFPNVKRRVNLPVQADQALARLTGRHEDRLGFLDAIYVAGLHARQGDAGVEFHGVSYRKGVLDVQLRSRSASAIESYRNMIVADSLSAELVAVDSERGHVMGRLRIAKQRP